jgi:dolichol-phosphate mannosyltransferase
MKAELPGAHLLHEDRRPGEALVVLPVYNERPILDETLDAVRCWFDGNVLVVDDASTDGSGEYLASRSDVTVLRNEANAGAGGVLLRAFAFACERGHDPVVTLDADGQHNACQIPEFLYALEATGVDMVWGTRYPGGFTPLAEPYQARQRINRIITARLCAITGWPITDSFCGFRAYRRHVLVTVRPAETGYGMLLAFAVLAWQAGFSMRHHPVPLIYLDPARDFNGAFADDTVRLAYYQGVIDGVLDRPGRCGSEPVV